MRRILVIDNEYKKEVIDPLKVLLEPIENMCYIGESDASKSLDAIYNQRPDVVLLDLSFSDHHEDFEIEQGIQQLKNIKQERSLGKMMPPVIILTKLAGRPDIIEKTQKYGAIFFLAKADIADIDMQKVVHQTIVDADNWGKAEVAKKERWNRRKNRLEIEVPDKEPIVFIGGSNQMQLVYDQIEEAAENDKPVMIYGETGTGKELVARAIHFHPKNERRQNPFVPHNMAVMSGDRGLIISELFGCPWNYPNDGDPGRQGIFQKACNLGYPLRPASAKGRGVPRIDDETYKNQPGTLFLDEVGRTPYEIQAMLLRVVETKKAEDLVGQEYDANARLICATNEDLYKLSEIGIKDESQKIVFRQDLLNRLEVIRIDVPSLNDHCEDIENLVDYFIEQENRNSGKNIKYVLPSTWTLLKRRIWKDANIRKLEILIRDCVRNSNGQVLQVSEQVRKYLHGAQEEG